MPEYAGRGDPRRTLELLWGRAAAPARGPKQGLTPMEIARAAIELADVEGLEGVTMRKVADRLGRSAMSLYTYVPSKAELIDLMLDTALGDLPGSYATGRGWRADAEASARAGWELYQRHPWLLQVSAVRSLMGPNETRTYEALLAVFDGIGLDGLQMSRIVGLLADFVRGVATSLVDASLAERVTGMSDDEWWHARSPVFEELAGEDFAERFPVITRIQSHEDTFSQPFDDSLAEGRSYTEAVALDTFEFGLARLLDGVEVYIDQVAIDQVAGRG